MLSLKYSVSSELLQNIKRICVLVAELNRRVEPKTVLVELERHANTLSAFASTSIEGNPLPLTDVKQLLRSAPANIRDAEREVLNYNAVLETMNRRIDAGQVVINEKWICQIHRHVMAGLMEKIRCGKFRKDPVFVNDPRTGKTIYWPPDHAEVPQLMADLVEFVRCERGRMDPLLLAGLFHKRCVIIHPFLDGNGRTTRLVTKALLADLGIHTFHLFSFENYYNRNVTRYFEYVGLRGNYYEVGDCDFTPWLEYFAEGILDELQRVQKTLDTLHKTPVTRIEAHHQKLLRYIEQHGFITDRDYAKLVPRAKATRVSDFNQLMDLGVIERHGQGRATHYRMK